MNNRRKITGSKHHQFRKAGDRSETSRSLMITGRDILLCVIFGVWKSFEGEGTMHHVRSSIPVIVNHDALDAL